MAAASFAWAAPPGDVGVERIPTFAACTSQGVQRNSHSTSALENSASCTVCYYSNDTENLTHILKSMVNFALGREPERTEIRTDPDTKSKSIPAEFS